MSASTVRHVEIVVYVAPTLVLRFVVVDFAVDSVRVDRGFPSPIPANSSVRLAILRIAMPSVCVDPIVVEMILIDPITKIAV